LTIPLFAGVCLLAVALLLRVSLHLTKRQYLLVWTLAVPALLACVPQLLAGALVWVLLIAGWLVIGLWVYHRWWPVGAQFAPHGLHTARFAGYRDIQGLTTSLPPPNGLLLGRHSPGEFLSVRPTPTRRELGNMLIV
jgi:hypothetical protein